MKIEVKKMDVETLETLEELDKEVFPEHFWLNEDEADALLGADTTVVLIFSDSHQLIGAAYGVPSLQIAKLMSEFDEYFSANEEKFYVYSVAVIKTHRRQGVGRMLRSNLIAAAHHAGFESGCTHTRINGESNVAAKVVYSPIDERLIKDFYSEGEDSMYMEFLIPTE